MKISNFTTHKFLQSCFLVIILAWFSSCTSTRKTANTKLQGLKYSYCTPVIPYPQKPGQDSIDIDLSKSGISNHDQLLSKILGISSNINGLLVLGKDSKPDKTIQRLLLKQKIAGRLLIAQSELQAVAAELDCEGERADMAADYLDNMNSKRNKNFTVGSVIIGALTTVATATISKNSTQVAVGISGGLVSAGLGAFTINPKGRKLEFYHKRNLLRTIWIETSSNADYPVFVWMMLHEKKFSNKGDITLAQSIKNRWVQFQFDGKPDSDQEKLLFGDGGNYHADDLHTRSSMINQLQSTIRSINQDLISLVVFIENM